MVDIMKIMAVSDVHQSLYRKHGRDESKNFIILLNKIRFEKPNLLLICGDLQDVNLQNMDELFDLCSEENVEVAAIYGNHDNPQILKNTNLILPNFSYSNLDCGLTIAGIGGITSERRPNGFTRLNEAEFKKRINLIKNSLLEDNKSLDIFISHEFPRLKNKIGNIFYDTRNSEAIGNALYCLKPKLAISGHLHGYNTMVFPYEFGTVINLAGFTDKHYTVINVNTSPFVIIDIKDIIFE